MKAAKIVIDNAVRIPMKRIPSEAVDALKLAFTFDNPDYHLKRLLKIRGWWNEKQDVGTWGEDGSTLVVPRGGLSRVREILAEHDVVFKLLDQRHEGGIVEHFPAYKGPTLHYYQEEGIAAAFKKENCIIRLPTGTGKSLMAIAFAAKVKLNCLVILPTVGLFTQWCQDAVTNLKMNPKDLGVIHRQKRSLRPITAAVQGTLASKGVDEEIRDFFGVVILDEVQKAAARTVYQVIQPFPARYRIGISADERRKDKKEFLTNGLFGKVEYEKKRKELEDQGYIVNVEIRVVPTRFEADWYGLSQHADDSREIDFPRLVDEMVLNQKRTKLGLRQAFDEVRAGEQVIILSHRVEHCLQMDREFVKRGIVSGFFIGDHEKEFEKTRQGIKDGSVRVGVGTYHALGVGVNLPAVSVGVAMTPIAGNQFNFNQVRGRLNRKNKGKDSARLYVLWDRFVYPKHLKNMIAWNPTVSVLHQDKWVDGRWYQKHVVI